MNQLIENNLNQEELFILLCCQKVSTDKPIGSIDDLLTKNLDWDFISRIADLHSIAGLIYLTLSQCSNITCVPVNLLKNFEARYHRNALSNLHYSSEFHSIVTNLSRANIRTIPLKGIEFLHSIYSHNIAVRHLSDIDILVEKIHVTCAEKILLEMGYTRKKRSLFDTDRQFHSIFYRIQGKIFITVELHWDVDYSDSPFKMNIEELWGRSREISNGKLNYYALSIEDNIIFNSFHILRSARKGLDVFWPLKNFCDIARLIKQGGARIDWDCILQRSQEYNITRPLFFVLMLVQELFDVKEIPQATVDAIRTAGYRDEFGCCAVKEYIFSRQLKDKNIFPFWAAELSDHQTLTGKIETIMSMPGIIRHLYKAKYYGDSNHSAMKAVISTTWHYLNKTFSTLARYVFTPQKAIMLKNRMTMTHQKTKEVINWIRG
jgi:hypothetical protein